MAKRGQRFPPQPHSLFLSHITQMLPMRLAGLGQSDFVLFSFRTPTFPDVSGEENGHPNIKIKRLGSDS
ncbi:hypothetical protein BaRGS_00037255 [Batillaria attramentaria]|uniref:Uncharacterized protein n=1 Tax=Batillaria attramentaria TaxID=370345 RepID=A0ABD0J9C6_9CAEN